FGAIFVEAEEGCARAVAGGDEDKVVDDERGGGTDGGVNLRRPGKFKRNFARRRIERSQVFASEEEGEALAMDCGDDRGGVAGFVVGGLPKDFAGGLIERD